MSARNLLGAIALGTTIGVILGVVGRLLDLPTAVTGGITGALVVVLLNALRPRNSAPG